MAIVKREPDADGNIWSEEEVAALNRYQAQGRFHPFTCGSGDRRDDVHTAAKEEHGDRDYGLLVATRKGWVCRACSYTQDWAHDFMFKDSYIGVLDPFRFLKTTNPEG